MSDGPESWGATLIDTGEGKPDTGKRELRISDRGLRIDAEGNDPLLSEEFVSTVKGWEGFTPRAKWDYKQSSVGYGTRARAADETITHEEADRRLREELTTHARNVDKAAKEFGYELTPRQREALIAFDFNTGSARSVMQVSDRDMADLTARMGRYVHAGGGENEGLKNRRAKELAYMNGGGDQDGPIAWGAKRVDENDPRSWGATPVDERGMLANAGNQAIQGALDQGFYSGVEGITRGAAGLVRRLPKGVADAAVAGLELYGGRVPAVSGGADRLATGLQWYADAVKDTRQDIRETFPVDESFQQSLGGQVIAGLGQAAGTLPTFVIPGFGPAVAAGQMYDQGYQDAVSKGADERTAQNAALMNVPAAALDYLSDKLIIGRILKPLRGRITVGDLLKSVGTSAAIEGATEAAQQGWQNLIAKTLSGYDPTRPLDDQVINSAIVGAIVGGTVTGVGTVGSAALAVPANDGPGLSEVKVEAEVPAGAEEIFGNTGEGIPDTGKDDVESPVSWGATLVDTGERIPETGEMVISPSSDRARVVDENLSAMAELRRIKQERAAARPGAEAAPEMRSVDTVQRGMSENENTQSLDPEAAAAQAEYQREQEAMLREAEEENTIGLGEALAKVGGLPGRRSPYWREWGGELGQLWEARRGARQNAKTRGVFTNLFRDDAESMDTVAESLREQGFAVDTADDVFALVDDWLRSGREPRATIGFEAQVADDNIPFSQQIAGAEEQTRTDSAALERAVREGFARAGVKNVPPVRFVQTVDELTDVDGGTQARAAGTKGAVVEAFFDPRPGQRGITIVLEGAARVAAQRGLSLEERVQQLGLHELVHHFQSVGALFPAAERAEYGRVIEGVIARVAPEEAQRLAGLYGWDLGTLEGRAALAEETLARLAETARPPSWVIRAWAQIREVLRRVFPQLRWSNAEIRDLLARAARQADRSVRADGLRFSQQPDAGETHREYALRTIAELAELNEVSPEQAIVYVVAATDGEIQDVFPTKQDAEQYLASDAMRGEWLWEIERGTSNARLQGGVAERQPRPADHGPHGVYGPPPNTRAETAAEAGALPRHTPFGETYQGGRGKIRIWGETGGSRLVSAREPEQGLLFALADDDPRLQPTHLIDTPERQAWRESQIRERLAAAEPTPEDEMPTVWLLGGGGASGKSTIRAVLQKAGLIPERVVTIDPDSFKEAAPEKRIFEEADDSRWASVTHEESSKLADETLQRAMAERKPIIVDKTLKDEAKTLRLMRQLRAQGYAVELIAVTIDPELALERARERARATKRVVPEEELRQAHRGFNSSLPAYVRELEDVRIYDNTGSTPVTILEKKAGKLVALNEEIYAKIRERGQSRDEETERQQEAAKAEPNAGQTVAGNPRHHGGHEGNQGRGEAERAAVPGGVSGEGLKAGLQFSQQTPEERRKFIASAKASPFLHSTLRDRVESLYTPITNKETVEAARARINDRGIDGAMGEVLATNERNPPTALSNAIGIDLIGRLQAMERYGEAARIVEHMAEQATTQGQAIQALSLLARLSAEGVQFYAERQVQKAAARDPQVQQLLDEVKRLRDELAKAKRAHGTNAILEIQDLLASLKLDPERLAQLNTKLRQALIDSPANPGTARDRLVQMLMSAGMDRKKARKLAERAIKAFAREAKKAREKLLRDMLKVKAPRHRIPSSELEKWRTLNAEGALDDESLYEKIATRFGLPIFTREMARRVQALQQDYEAAPDGVVKLVKAAEVLDTIHSMLPADFWSKVPAVQNISMLLNPKTGVRNLLGNAVMWIGNVTADGFAAAVDPLVSITSGQRTYPSASIGTRLRGLRAPLEDFRAGQGHALSQGVSKQGAIAAGVKTMIEMARLTSGGKYDVRSIGRTHRHVFSSRIGWLFEDLLSVTLGVFDRAFHQSAYLAALEREMRTRGEVAPSYESVAVAQFEAAKAVYQDENFVSASLGEMVKVVNRFSTAGRTDRYGLGTIIMPFTQVPGSILLRGSEWSPIGFIRTGYEVFRPVIGKEFRQREFVDAFSRATLGSGAMALGYLLFRLGVISGAPEDDPDREAMRRAAGLGAYRLNASELKRRFLSGNFHSEGSQYQRAEDGDVILNYDWLQPSAMPLAMGAQMAQREDEARREMATGKVVKLPSSFLLMAMAGSRTLEEQPLLTGLFKFIKDIGNAQQQGESALMGVAKALAGTPGNFVPGTFAAQIGQLVDNTPRETRAGTLGEAEMNHTLARIPALAHRFPAKYDTFGEMQERYQYGRNTLFNVLINPAFVTEVRKNPVAAELERIYAATGNASALPATAQRKIVVNGKPLELTNEQLSEYQRYTGRLTMTIFGRLIASPAWARLPDEEKARILAGVVSDVNTAAKQELFGQRPVRVDRDGGVRVDGRAVLFRGVQRNSE